MFWKWKRKSDRPTKRSDAPLFEAPRERRGAYRIDPDPNVPVTVCVDEETHPVFNISAGGLAFPAPGLSSGVRRLSSLHLPDGCPPSEVMLEVIRRGEGETRHCRFIDLSSELEDRIHQYVLERSKELIRNGQG